LSARQLSKQPQRELCTEEKRLAIDNNKEGHHRKFWMEFGGMGATSSRKEESISESIYLFVEEKEERRPALFVTSFGAVISGRS